MSEPDHITTLLQSWSNGDRSALDKLLPMIYSELRRVADSYLRRERINHTLQPTALINEAVIRLIGNSKPLQWESRSQLIGVFARAMREVLVDSARRRHAAKRPNQADRVDLDAIEINVEDDASVLSVNEALGRLEEIQPRQAHVVELKYFGGLTLEEIAKVMGTSETTVTRDWRLARAWLRRAMDEAPG